MTERRSYPVPPSPKAWDNNSMTSTLQWLCQDVHDRIIPNWSQKEPYEISSDALPWHKISSGLEIGQYAQGVEDFILGVTLHLLMNHEIWIEVALDSGKGEDPPFRVHEANRVERDKSGRLIQLIPDQSELPAWIQSDHHWPQTVDLDHDRMVCVRLPSAYPEKVLRKIMIELTDIEPLLPPSWVYREVNGTLPNASIYNVNEAEWNSRLLTFKVSDPIGWTAREGLRGTGRRLNDYYYTLRELRFLHFIASLRQSAEQALREVLTIAGDLCGFKASVTANGVYSPEDVCRLIAKFESGKLTFSELPDILFQRPSAQDLMPRIVV